MSRRRRLRLLALLGLGLLLMVGLPRSTVRAEAEDTPAQLTVVDYAASKIGAHYAWGAAGPTVFDCSGFVQFVYGQVGVRLPHYSDSIMALGYPVSLEEAQPGDVVGWRFRDPRQPHTVWPHIGVYVGDELEIDDSYGVAVRSIWAFPHPEIRRLA